MSSYQDEESVYEVDGKPNVVDLLYTEDGINQYPTYDSDDANAYKVIDNNVGGVVAPTSTVRLLVPSGLEELYSAEVGDTLFMNWRNRAQVRAYITKFPFNYFSGY